MAAWEEAAANATENLSECMGGEVRLELSRPFVVAEGVCFWEGHPEMFQHACGKSPPAPNRIDSELLEGLMQQIPLRKTRGRLAPTTLASPSMDQMNSFLRVLACADL